MENLDKQVECNHSFVTNTTCKHCGLVDNREKKTYVFICGGFYWGKGKTLKEARHFYRKASGKFPPKDAIITIVHGTRADEAGVDGMGAIHWYNTDDIITL